MSPDADREEIVIAAPRMSIAEFRRLGYVQEINRLLLHPCGLALEVSVAEDGTETLGGIWDYREDPEGIYYSGNLTDDLSAKALRVAAERARRADARIEMLGYIVQPVDGMRRQR